MIKRYTVLVFFLSLVSPVMWAQMGTSDDLHRFMITGGQTPAETAVLVGKQFIGVPYVPHTLDDNPSEQLVVNLRAFDCTTFLETALALALTQHVSSTQPTPAEPTFRAYLTQFRYRGGRIDGYASRLHYFSDWLRDNERKGFLTDVTAELPGSILVAKPLSYMTTAVHRYPRLNDPAVFKQIAFAEAALSQQSFAFIPRKNIQQAEAQLRDGDIVMLTAARPGLDMKHVGLAVRLPSGRIHLLHASSEQGEVVITTYPLSDYVLGHKHLSGIRVARLRGSTVLSAAVVKK